MMELQAFLPFGLGQAIIRFASVSPSLPPLLRSPRSLLALTFQRVCELNSSYPMSVPHCPPQPPIVLRLWPPVASSSPPPLSGPPSTGERPALGWQCDLLLLEEAGDVCPFLGHLFSSRGDQGDWPTEVAGPTQPPCIHSTNQRLPCAPGRVSTTHWADGETEAPYKAKAPSPALVPQQQDPPTSGGLSSQPELPPNPGPSPQAPQGIGLHGSSLDPPSLDPSFSRGSWSFSPSSLFCVTWPPGAQETDQLEEEKAELESEIAELQKEKERLEFVLVAHKPGCKIPYEEGPGPGPLAEVRGAPAKEDGFSWLLPPPPPPPLPFQTGQDAPPNLTASLFTHSEVQVLGDPFPVVNPSYTSSFVLTCPEVSAFAGAHRPSGSDQPSDPLPSPSLLAL